ncbi:MAG: hypothetical protein ABEI98_03570 [Halorhabdus sp.]
MSRVVAGHAASNASHPGDRDDTTRSTCVATGVAPWDSLRRGREVTPIEWEGSRIPQAPADGNDNEDVGRGRKTPTMSSGMGLASLVFAATGAVLVYAGHRVESDGRADQIFAPGLDAPEADVARVGGRATVLAGVATVGLGFATLAVEPTARGWALVLAPYTAVCLGIAMWSRRRLARATAD